jgi:hypothetical protein
MEVEINGYAAIRNVFISMPKVFNVDGVTQNNIMVQSNVYGDDDIFWNEMFNVEFPKHI